MLFVIHSWTSLYLQVLSLPIDGVLDSGVAVVRETQRLLVEGRLFLYYCLLAVKATHPAVLLLRLAEPVEPGTVGGTGYFAMRVMSEILNAAGWVTIGRKLPREAAQVCVFWIISENCYPELGIE